MFNLFIDTSNNFFCYLAIYHDDVLIDETKIEVNKNVTDLIVDLIKSILEKNKLSYANIDNLYLNIGPGSFTGIKVSAVIAKTWKLIQPKIRIYGASSLLLQVNCPEAISIIDAKTQKYFVAIISHHHYLIEPCLYSQQEIVDLKKKYPQFRIVENNENEIKDLFLYHQNYFDEITNLYDFEPLYIKDPV